MVSNGDLEEITELINRDKKKIIERINAVSEPQESGEPEEDAVMGRVPKDPNDDEEWGYLRGLQDALRIIEGTPPMFRSNWS